MITPFFAIGRLVHHFSSYESVGSRLKTFHGKNPKLRLTDKMFLHDLFTHCFLRKNSTSTLGELRGSIDRFVGTILVEERRVPQTNLAKLRQLVETARLCLSGERQIPLEQIRTVSDEVVQHWYKTAVERAQQLINAGIRLPDNPKKLVKVKVPKAW